MGVAWLLCCMLFLLSSGLLSAQAPHYRMIQRAKTGGTGGWDYLTLDGDAKRLYVTRGSHVMVLDSDSLSVVGDIVDTAGVHGVAIVPELHRGFTSNGAANSVTVFDLTTLRPVGRVEVGNTPDAILYDSVSGRVFTFNARGRDTTAIDARSLHVAGTVPLGGKPEFAVADGKGAIFVNIEDTAEIVMFHSRNLSVLHRWKMQGCEEPTGLALDREHGRLFAGCHNGKMYVVDSGSGRTVATLPIGQGVDGTAFDPATMLGFSSNGVSGTLTVVREETPEKFAVVENVSTAAGARTMVLDPGSHKVYTATQSPSGFEVILLSP